MTFSGSRQIDSAGFAYFLYNNILYIRTAALLFVIAGTFNFYSHWRKWQRVSLIIPAPFYTVVFYVVNFEFVADKMFPPIHDIQFSSFTSSHVNDDKLAAAVTINGESKAYPLEIIGYHHGVQDIVGGEPVLVTYCIAFHTARVYSSLVIYFLFSPL